MPRQWQDKLSETLAERQGEDYLRGDASLSLVPPSYKMFNGKNDGNIGRRKKIGSAGSHFGALR